MFLKQKFQGSCLWKNSICFSNRIQIGSIRENIIFESPMDDAKKCKCSLIKDIEMLPVGDLTEIGERSIEMFNV
jgi:hypothetical protein